MDEKKDELIDLNKLSQRELLIVMHNDVKDLKKEMHQMGSEMAELKLKVNTLETKSKVWGSVTGFLSALGTLFLERLLNIK